MDMFENWFKHTPKWTSDHKTRLLSAKNNNDIIKTQNNKIIIDDIIEKSSNFPVKFPLKTVCCNFLQTKLPLEELEKNINSAYPIVHEEALRLYSLFLDYETTFGNNRDFYKNMSLLQLIDRLLTKRAVMFINASDNYLLLDGSEGAGNWEKIGTKSEKPPLILKNCLSYDEIKLSALLSVSSYTYFINDGNRYNRGVFEENRENIQDNGIIIGLIGARLEKRNVMEYREIVKIKTQSVPYSGYGGKNPSLQALFMDFYGDDKAIYTEMARKFENDHRYINLGDGTYFDVLMFERRITISIDTLLIEANGRAKEENSKAFVHVVGLGLGVWKIYEGQDRIFMDTFAKRLEFLGPKLNHISDICFAYIRHEMAGQYKDGDKIHGIQLHFLNRNPHEKLKCPDERKLLVVSYAWDGNALPGNEFWLGALSASGDPAAASSTQIAELHNAHINRKVSASNLRVATLNGDLLTFEEYQQLHEND